MINGYMALQIIWNSGEICLGWQEEKGSVPHLGESRYLSWMGSPLEYTSISCQLPTWTGQTKRTLTISRQGYWSTLVLGGGWTLLGRPAAERQLNPTPRTSESWQRASIMLWKHADEGSPRNSCSDLKLLELVANLGGGASSDAGRRCGAGKHPNGSFSGS